VIGGCAQRAERPKHLVLIVVDTLRADVLGCYGGEAVTPNIDRLAAEGARFEWARSHIPITGPSHLSLFTSLLPNQHGLRNNAQVVPDDVELLAEILKRSGFETTGVVSLGVLESKFGFSRGFDRYDDRVMGRFWRDAAEVNEVALPLIQSETRRRQFLWIHYSDPHAPYAPPDGDLPTAHFYLGGSFVAEVRLDGRYFSIPIDLPPGETELEVRPSEGDSPRRVALRRLRICGGEARIEPGGGLVRGKGQRTKNMFFGRTPASAVIVNPGLEAITGGLEGTIEFTPRGDDLHRLYRKEVEFTDRQIGRLTAALRSKGIWEDSVVVFVGDHGEGLGESGRFGHVDHLYDETLRVPLIVVAPNRLTPGTVVSTSVRLIDVLPTVLEMLDVTPPAGMTGESLSTLIEQSGPDRPVVGMTYEPQAELEGRVLVSNGFKYIWTIDNDGRELFDLADDPHETDNLVDQNPALADAMHEALQRALADSQADRLARPAELSQEEIEGLEALGYVH